MFVENHRKNRIRRERSAPYAAIIEDIFPVLNEYARSLPLGQVFPNTLELCLRQPVRELIDLAVDADTTIDIERFRELLPDALATWRDEISAHLFELLPPWLKRDSTNSLESALIWFRCSYTTTYGCFCSDTSIAYPRVIGHNHFKQAQGLRTEPESAEDDIVNAFRDKHTYSVNTFSVDMLQQHAAFDLHASFVACEIVACCGLDPATARAEDMDALDARVACVPCKVVMNWRKAVCFFSLICDFSADYRP
jgi:hypothetical protein